MDSPILELEGTWEEILQHESDLRGKRVHVRVIEKTQNKSTHPKSRRGTTGKALLRHAGKWAGDDLEERLEEAVANRLPAEF